uniref:Uncharacterized protein n=1 Tax=Agaricus bisporus virus 7 TaxID=1945751 RepID=A0A1Q1N6I0_9VIRU|nr:hypothetical protein [Agaricus bisporus virus 7]
MFVSLRSFFRFISIPFSVVSVVAGDGAGATISLPDGSGAPELSFSTARPDAALQVAVGAYDSLSGDSRPFNILVDVDCSKGTFAFTIDILEKIREFSFVRGRGSAVIVGTPEVRFYAIPSDSMTVPVYNVLGHFATIPEAPAGKKYSTSLAVVGSYPTALPFFATQAGPCVEPVQFDAWCIRDALIRPVVGRPPVMVAVGSAFQCKRVRVNIAGVVKLTGIGPLDEYYV